MIGFYANSDKQPQLYEWSAHYRTFRVYLAFSALLLWLVGCTFPGDQNRDIPQIQLTVQNTLPIKRVNLPIVLSLAELKQVAPDFSFDAYLIVSGQPPVETEIPSQADDTNYDGHRDELVFLIDLEPQETKNITIRYAPDNEMSITLGFARRTRAGIFPELAGFAALESEWVAYLLHPNGSIDAYGKKTKGLFLDQFVRQATAPSDSDEAILTPLFTTHSFGLWDADMRRLIPFEDQREYVRVIVDGPVRSVVQRIIPSWTLPSNREIAFTSTFSIYAGHQWGEHRLQVKGLGDEHRVAVHLPSRITTPFSNEKDGWVWGWETEVETDDETGFGLIFPAEGFDTLSASEAGNTILMELDQHDEVFYRFASALGAEDAETGTPDVAEVEIAPPGMEAAAAATPEPEKSEIVTQEAFEQYIQAMATAIRTPPVIRFTPQESQAQEKSED